MHVLKTTHDVLSQLGVDGPRIACSGLNCHAGENGLFGSEEDDIIRPAMARARTLGVDVEGPFGADTMFQKKGYDGFVIALVKEGA